MFRDHLKNKQTAKLGSPILRNYISKFDILYYSKIFSYLKRQLQQLRTKFSHELVMTKKARFVISKYRITLKCLYGKFK